MSAHTSLGEEVILFDDDRALMHLNFCSGQLDRTNDCNQPSC